MFSGSRRLITQLTLVQSLTNGEGHAKAKARGLRYIQLPTDPTSSFNNGRRPNPSKWADSLL